MILYYTTGACSLAARIVMREGGIDFKSVRVDLQTHKTESGEDYYQINPKGYVPALQLDDGALLTENVALLDYLSQKVPALKPADELARSRLIEMQTFLSTEIHKPYSRVFFSPDDADKARAREQVINRYNFLAPRVKDGAYLLGKDYSAVDAFLFVTLTWADVVGITPPPALQEFKARIAQRPAVQAALRDEGLLK